MDRPAVSARKSNRQANGLACTLPWAQRRGEFTSPPLVCDAASVGSAHAWPVPYSFAGSTAFDLTHPGDRRSQRHGGEFGMSGTDFVNGALRSIPNARGGVTAHPPV